MNKITSISDIVRWRLCVGCGACASICPENNIRLIDVLDEGIRPQIADPSRCGSCKTCLDVCPGDSIDYTNHSRRTDVIPELLAALGPIIEIWEGHASDPQVRFQGSSGGALTALALYCLEQERMDGVLHIGQNPDDPIRNMTRLSRSRDELLSFTGSRYAPASVCDRLDLIENAPKPCVFIGQPSEVSALRKAQKLRPALQKNVGVVLSFFCAGSPSTRGTFELLRKLRVPANLLGSMRYRGRGWPGMFATSTIDEPQLREHQTYQESWAFLQKFRPYATHLQPDGAGEEADISCGDPWYRDVAEDENGSSLIAVRTERGREIVQGALKAGYLQLSRAEPWKLLESQKNLIEKRRTIWGRRLAFQALGLPTTRLKGLPLFSLWLGLPLKEKIKSVFGTARRIIKRKYYRPASISAAKP